MSATTLLVGGMSITTVVLAAVMAGAVLALALTLVLISGDKRSNLERRLTGYDLDEARGDVSELVPEPETQIVQQVVGITGRLADRVGLLNRVEGKLEQADLPLRPPEAIFSYLVGMLVVAFGSVVLLSRGMAVVFIVVGAVLPVALLELRRKRRLRKFEIQLPDVLSLLAGSMRAGFSFVQGLEAVAEEASEPARRELQRAFAESRLGRPVEDALEDSANRMQSVDLLWAVMAIRIQREVGGNLAELLDTVAQTMTQRERLKHEILALTAEGRLTAWILGIFPPGFALVLYGIQPDYMSKLFQNSVGVIAVIVAAIMAGFGFVWLRKLMRIEV